MFINNYLNFIKYVILDSGNRKVKEMIDNKMIYAERWKPETLQYMKKSFIHRYQSFLINYILTHYKNALNIYIYRIADCGCGLGLHTVTLAKCFPNAQVYGFDFSEQGIAIANKYNKRSNLSFHTKDVTNEDFGTFDLISAFEVLEHIEDWKLLLEKFVNNSRKYLLFSFPVGRMRKYEKMGGHLRNFKRKEVESFLETLGVKPLLVLYAGFPFFSPIYREACGWLSNTYEKAYYNIMSRKVELLHHVMYFLASCCSTKKYFGDQFIGLFEKAN